MGVLTLCWKLDRLARNPVDGGAIIWAMEEGKLKAIHTPQRSFSNTSNDKFWMQLEFGMAKKYVDDLSDNVKRGLRAKLEAGWLPGVPPIGYLNDRNSRTIVKDPERFRLIRKMWDMMLTGNITPPRILAIATKEWGLRTRVFRRQGGGPMALSAIYDLFRNPFYYGLIVRRGLSCRGAHEAMVSKSEFDLVQRLLTNNSSPRPRHREFAFTGLIKCGECGASVTAEHKVNRQGHQYVYYHCTKRRPGIKCGQRVIELNKLERQIVQFLEQISIPKVLVGWTLRHLKSLDDKDKVLEAEQALSIERRLGACAKELSELTNLRIRGLLSDEEYIEKKRELEDERIGLQESVAKRKHHSSEVGKRCANIFEFAGVAVRRFQKGTDRDKREILHSVGSNLTLRDGILNIEAVKPFQLIRSAIVSPEVHKLMIEPSISLIDVRRNDNLQPAFRLWCSLFEKIRTEFAGGGSRAEETQPPPAAAPF
ncbi:hypothetical protein C4546_01785 [Candidatus Parcubacteria bacterium]|nr:MAG: hypothetical protein C4546_01785 [Candidatus Parcubacteria bacterium]